MTNIIVACLLVLPAYGVLTDLREGKIRNYFLFPSIVSLLMFTLFIEGFYVNVDNLISLAIIVAFSYLFYKDNRWGAGDGKYLILIGLSTVVIGYLKGVTYLTLSLFFVTFTLFLLYVTGFLLLRIPVLMRIKFDRYRPNAMNLITPSMLVFEISSTLVYFLPAAYSLLITFVFMMLIIPHLIPYIAHRYVRIILIGTGLAWMIWRGVYISGLVTFFMYCVFDVIRFYSDKIFDMVDTISFPIINLKQGNILTKGSREKIRRESGIELYESPLQGFETYEVLEFYKKVGRENDKIMVYKDIKLGIILYVAFILVVLYKVFGIWSLIGGK